MIISPTGSLHTVPWALFTRREPPPVVGGAVGGGVDGGRASPRRPRRAVRGRARPAPRRARGRRSGPLVPPGPHPRRRRGHRGRPLRAGSGAQWSGPPRPATARSAATTRCFSSLRLADGPAHGARPEQPRRRCRSSIVLSACESGLSAVAPGDELMGLASAFLGSRRSRPDRERRSGTRRTRAPVHGVTASPLGAGDSVSSALSETQAAWARRRRRRRHRRFGASSAPRRRLKPRCPPGVVREDDSHAGGSRRRRGGSYGCSTASSSRHLLYVADVKLGIAEIPGPMARRWVPEIAEAVDAGQSARAGCWRRLVIERRPRRRGRWPVLPYTCR